MDSDILVNKVLRDLKMAGYVFEDTSGELRPFLNALFVAGWERGFLDAHQTTAKRIGQYSIGGNLIKSFSSLRDACRKTGFSKTGIIYSMKNNIPTRQKWYWKYLT